MKSFQAQSVGVSAFVHRFGRALLSLCVLAFLATFLISVHTRPASASAPGSSVTIANTPLPVTGNVNAAVSGTVGISGSPSVNASQSGAWTVGINGTPTVNLASTGNLQVTATGDPALTTFHATTASGGGNVVNSYCSATITNPASSGQTFVVENESAFLQLRTGQKVSFMSVSGAVNGNPVVGYGLDPWLPTYQADDGVYSYIGASQAMKLYFPAGVDIYFASSPTSLSDSGECIFGISGYIVNVH